MGKAQDYYKRTIENLPKPEEAEKDEDTASDDSKMVE